MDITIFGILDALNGNLLRFKYAQPNDKFSVQKLRDWKEWMGRDLNSRPPVCETGIITSLDHPSQILLLFSQLIS
jgi:hypothetical protein